jgi:hypothetical protein
VNDLMLYREVKRPKPVDATVTGLP